MSEGAGGRLGRWSRLKHQRTARRRRGGAAPRPEAPSPPAAAEPADHGGGEAAAAAIDGAAAGGDDDVAAALPPIDSLDKDSDYTPFLAQGVPEHLARAALRKLWLSDPAFAVLDGLNDYDEDFTIVEALVGALDTDGGTPSAEAAEDAGAADADGAPEDDAAPDAAPEDDAAHDAASEDDAAHDAASAAGTDDAGAAAEAAAAQADDSETPPKDNGSA